MRDATTGGFRSDLGGGLVQRRTHLFYAERNLGRKRVRANLELRRDSRRQIRQRAWWRRYRGFGDDGAWFAFTCCDPCTVYGEVDEVSRHIEIERTVEEKESETGRALQTVTVSM
jgi:hypothetical protein